MNPSLLAVLIGCTAIVGARWIVTHRDHTTKRPAPTVHQVPGDVLAAPVLPTMATAAARDVLAAHTAALLACDPRFDQVEQFESAHYLLTEQWLTAGDTLDQVRERLNRPHTHVIEQSVLPDGRSRITHAIQYADTRR